MSEATEQGRRDNVEPLEAFYAGLGLTLPAWEEVPGDRVPEPYRKLLVHRNDMTPTLESFHGERISIRVLRRHRDGNTYGREVVLVTPSGRPVEFGAIRIHLDHFPEPARRAILEESLPLGTILHAFQIPHQSRPRAFLKVESDDTIRKALSLRGSHSLFGRRNTLYTPEGESLAEIVEILPPETTIQGKVGPV